MYKLLRYALWRLWRMWSRGPREDRAATERDRFWAEYRAGQREAKARSRP
jgi:hypothetical protein